MNALPTTGRLVAECALVALWLGGALLVGIAVISRAHGIVATEPGQPGYQSVLSMVVHSVIGHGTTFVVTLPVVQGPPERARLRQGELLGVSPVTGSGHHS